MKRVLLLIPLLVISIAGCSKPADPEGSAMEAPGASKMPDAPEQTRPNVPGLNRGTTAPGGK